MKKRKIINRIFIPIAVAVFGLLLFVIILFEFFVNAHFKKIADQNLYETHILLQKIINQHADQMSGYIGILKNNKEISQNRLQRVLGEDAKNTDTVHFDSNSEQLFNLTKPLFAEMSSKHGVYYLAYFDADMKLITGLNDSLRVTAADSHQVIKKSSRTNGIVHGLIYDKDSILTLRVVYPWYINDTHVGFIEAGKKFSDITAIISQVFQIETSIGIRPYVAVGAEIDSSAFNILWNSYLRVNKINSMDLLSKSEYHSFLEVMPRDSLRPAYNLVEDSNVNYYVGFGEITQSIPMKILLCYYKDVSIYVKEAKDFTLMLSVVAIVVCLVIYLVFWKYVKSIESSLAKSHKELKKSKIESDVANRAKTNFLTNMSHEIRTPLNAIIGFSQILLKRSQTKVLGSEDFQFIENINASGKNLNLLINDILDLSKIEAGKAIVVERDFLIKEFIANIVSIYKPQAFKNRLEFVTYFDPDIPLSIKSDKGKINQILINLIGNAIKYTPDGSKIEFSILRESDSTIAIKVINEGVEIPRERQKIIFDPFERVTRDIHQNVKGTGLGLAITKNLVELLGGTIFLTSENQRTEFTVVIPYKETVVVEVSEEMSEVEKVFIEDATIIIVENNEMNISILETFFEDYNYKIFIEKDGKAALASIRENKPDLVLMDIELPEMNGLEVVETIRQDADFKTLPIIAMSANAFKEHKNEAQSAGMNDYITKPIDFDELIVVLEKYLYEKKVS